MINRTWLHKIEREGRKQKPDTVKEAIRTLKFILSAWEDEEADGSPPEIKPNKNREVVKRTKSGSMTLQLEKVNCGKATCQKCKNGPSHGPYWYGYWKEGGKTKSKYIGKNLSPD